MPRIGPIRRSFDGGSTLGPLQLPVPGTNTDDAASLHWMGTGLKVPRFTSYVVKVEGKITVSSNPEVLTCFPNTLPPYGLEGAYGPLGYTTNWRELRVQTGLQTAIGMEHIPLHSDGAGTKDDNEVHSDTLFATSDGEVWVVRDGIYALIGGGPNGCSAGFYALTSAQTISVTTLDGQGISITPKVALVKRGTQVQFTAKSGGQDVASPNWHFEPASDSANTTGDCGIGGANPCTITVNDNGRLHVAKELEGRMRSDVATIRLYSSFSLEADRSTASPGDTVRFTPIIDGTAGEAVRWVWKGDSTANIADPCTSIINHKCLYVPTSSGTMWAYTSTATGGDSASAHVTFIVPAKITLTVSRRSIPAPGDSVTFTATGNDTLVILGWSFTPDSQPPQAIGTWGSCQPGVATCRNFVSQTGRVTVEGTINGVSVRDSAEVVIVPCPTGDALVDDLDMRSALAFLMDKSRVPNPLQRKEHGMVIFQDTISKKLTFNFYVSDFSDGCTWTRSGNVPFPPNSMVVAHAHGHPFQRNEYLPPGVCNRAPLGGLGGDQGPSGVDDAAADSSGFREYVVDLDSIYWTDGPGTRWSTPRALGSCADILPPKPTPLRMPLSPPMRQRRSVNSSTVK